MELNDNEWRTLKIIEISMKHYEWVPLFEILKKTKTNKKEALYRLRILDRHKLINRSSHGYRLSHWGYDALALNTFIKKELLSAIGGKLGVGKEGDVYNIILTNKRKAVLKFHNIGRTCFSMGKRYRSYLAEKRHISWLYASRLTAQKEFEVLNELFPIVKVPEPIEQNRHAIIMGKIDGAELKKVDLRKLGVDIDKLFWDIIEEIKKMYKLNFVHCDLSEFNILIKEDGDFVIIDFPQALNINEEGQKFDKIPGEFSQDIEFYLKRDIGNILRHFKKYGINEDLNKIYDYIINE